MVRCSFFSCIVLTAVLTLVFTPASFGAKLDCHVLRAPAVALDEVDVLAIANFSYSDEVESDDDESDFGSWSDFLIDIAIDVLASDKPEGSPESKGGAISAALRRDLSQPSRGLEKGVTHQEGGTTAVYRIVSSSVNFKNKTCQ